MVNYEEICSYLNVARIPGVDRSAPLPSFANASVWFLFVRRLLVWWVGESWRRSIEPGCRRLEDNLLGLHFIGNVPFVIDTTFEISCSSKVSRSTCYEGHVHNPTKDSEFYILISVGSLTIRIVHTGLIDMSMHQRDSPFTLYDPLIVYLIFKGLYEHMRIPSISLVEGPSSPIQNILGSRTSSQIPLQRTRYVICI